MDDRSREKEIERQERCFGYWEAGRRKLAVQNGTNSKVTHSCVFEYFKRELKDAGVCSAADFHKYLRRRSNRLSRTNEN